MAITIQEEKDNLMVMRVTGFVKKAEVDAVQAEMVKKLGADTTVKLLIIVVNFEGWERDADWGDTGFYLKYGDKIKKIAVVGDPKWETEFMMFTAAGFRTAPVEFFPSDQIEDARIWLA